VIRLEADQAEIKTSKLQIPQLAVPLAHALAFPCGELIVCQTIAAFLLLVSTASDDDRNGRRGTRSRSKQLKDTSVWCRWRSADEAVEMSVNVKVFGRRQ
jgi:hypothetical protein